MKVAVIGGGSTYTPELVNGFLACRDTFPLDELWLMDIASDRLEIVGGFAQRMVSAKGSPFKVILSGSQVDSIRGASYVITQLRVGMMPARRADEYLGRRHGLIGQETTGIGGMAKALRTIPVVLGIAADMGKVAPGALLVNFTNPAGLVTEALSRHAPQVPAVGVCNVGITTKMTMLDGMARTMGRALDAHRAQLNTLGLNHLTWHRGFTYDDEELWPMIIEAYLAELRGETKPEWDPALIETLRMIPNYYLSYYYYTAHKLAQQSKWPPSRAEEVMQIEKDLLKEYANPDLIEPPAILMKRGGAYYSTLATELLNAHYNNTGQAHVVNVPHHGAVPGLPPDWVVEMPCKIDAAGIHPLPAEPLPTVCTGLVSQVKSYELLTVEAAVYGDHRAAYEALLAHPLGPSADQVEVVLKDMLETNKKFLPQFA
jgi:6-phospho-beta-glucosidase